MYKSCKTKQSAQRQRRIVDCLMEMMQAQTFGQITVQELCQRAQIPRKSFYRYFECKEDVFLAAVDFLMMDYAAFELPSRMTAETYTAMRQLEKVLVFCQMHQGLLASVLRSNLDNLLVERVTVNMIAQRMSAPGAQSRESELDCRISTMFFLSGLFAVVMDWIGRGCPESPSQTAMRLEKLLTTPLYPEAQTGSPL